ncbi:hypothetical protein KIPB_002668 [Kipferlia bialata]|uniref:Uncharacterized protein n=1 Tax=Kipferlia bialata TaxID=797122 RepID=A0A391NMI3_9EUKA|nr:hypothetical protein KIPB_002668 [Kipferlia bialata]|eukprot:g2668.t1
MDAATLEWATVKIPVRLEHHYDRDDIGLFAIPGHYVLCTTENEIWAYDVNDQEWMLWAKPPVPLHSGTGVFLGDRLHMLHDAMYDVSNSFHHCSIGVSGDWVTEEVPHECGSDEDAVAHNTLLLTPSRFFMSDTPHLVLVFGSHVACLSLPNSLTKTFRPQRLPLYDIVSKEFAIPEGTSHTPLLEVSQLYLDVCIH